MRPHPLAKELRISRFRMARRMAQLFPHAYRIRFHQFGRDREWFAWSIEEYVAASSHSQTLFQPDLRDPRLVIGPTGGVRRDGKKETNWTIIEHSDGWKIETDPKLRLT